MMSDDLRKTRGRARAMLHVVYYMRLVRALVAPCLTHRRERRIQYSSLFDTQSTEKEHTDCDVNICVKRAGKMQRVSCSLAPLAAPTRVPPTLSREHLPGVSPRPSLATTMPYTPYPPSNAQPPDCRKMQGLLPANDLLQGLRVQGGPPPASRSTDQGDALVVPKKGINTESNGSNVSDPKRDKAETSECRPASIRLARWSCAGEESLGPERGPRLPHASVTTHIIKQRTGWTPMFPVMGRSSARFLPLITTSWRDPYSLGRGEGGGRIRLARGRCRSAHPPASLCRPCHPSAIFRLRQIH